MSYFDDDYGDHGRLVKFEGRKFEITFSKPMAAEHPGAVP